MQKVNSPTSSWVEWYLHLIQSSAVPEILIQHSLVHDPDKNVLLFNGADNYLLVFV